MPGLTQGLTQGLTPAPMSANGIQTTPAAGVNAARQGVSRPWQDF